MRGVIQKVEEMWCQWAHEGSMWPIHGQYRCAKCFRAYRIDWDSAGAGPVTPAAVAHGLRAATSQPS